jgi:hypothetical protein
MNKLTLYDYLKELKILTNPSKIREEIKNVGQFEVIANTGSHNYGPIGTIFDLNLNFRLSGTSMSGAKKGVTTSNNIQFKELGYPCVNLETIEKRISDLKKEYNKELFELESKIDLIKNYSIEKLRPNTLRAYTIMKSLNLDSRENLLTIENSLEEDL